MHAFWHVFGWHAGESRESILDRKRTEITTNGWTLWSFRHRPRLQIWLDVISRSGSDDVIVLCSDSPSAQDPESAPYESTHFEYPTDLGIWHPLPSCIRSPHNFGSKLLGTAFLVSKVMEVPAAWRNSPVEWLSVTDGSWRSGPIPTRGEYLLRRGGNNPTRKCLCALQLSPPYIVTVTNNPPLC